MEKKIEAVLCLMTNFYKFESSSAWSLYHQHHVYNELREKEVIMEKGEITEGNNKKGGKIERK